MGKSKIGIQDVIHRIDDWKSNDICIKKISSGITNSNWFVEVSGARYFVRIPGHNTELFINRDLAHEAAMSAYRAGIAPETVYYLKDIGVEISKWLDGYKSCSVCHMHDVKCLLPSIDTLKRYHETSPLKNTVTIFNDIRNTYYMMEEIDAFRMRETDELLELTKVIEKSINKSKYNPVPCHNDLYVTNFMWNKDTQDMKLIDYEYAANNDPCYDLGIYSGEIFLYEDQEKEMIKRYFGEFNIQKYARMKLYKIAGDIKWVFWSCIQNTISKLDFEYIKYGYYMLHRMKVFVKDSNYNTWLKMA
jgi:thiamine kinase-like enzyme